MRLSIIIALYNTEKFIRNCLNSVYDGSFLNAEEFEVIVINDGSTDGSVEIVKELMNTHQNILLLNKENGGQSSARNIGFSMASGDYLFCLDSDDFLDSFELKKSLDLCYRLKLDLLPVDSDKYDENYQKLLNKSPKYKASNKIISGGMLLTSGFIIGSMCKYIYRKEIVDNFELKLTEGIFHEDEEFVTKFISRSKRIYKVDSLVYHQVIRSESTTNKKSTEHRKRLLFDLITVILNLENYRSNFGVNSLESKGLKMKINQLLISILIRMRTENIEKKICSEIVCILNNKGLLPIKIGYSAFKFWPAVLIYNNKTLRNLYLFGWNS